MSIRIMTNVWDYGPEKQGHLLIMLALADFANDTGECWPAMKTIADKARMTERGAQKIIRTLEAEGWLFIDTGNGRHGCNRYLVNPERCSPPEQGSPRTTTRKTPNVDTETPNNDAETPNGGSPEPLRTINNRKRTVLSDPALIPLCQAAGQEAVESFIAYRKGHKAKALTETAAKRLATALREIMLAGHDTDDALAMAEERGWASVSLDWYENALRKNTKSQPNYGGHNERLNNSQATQRTDPALEQISRLARTR